MDIFQFTRQLIDIESITGNEAAVGEFLFTALEGMGFVTRRMAVPAVSGGSVERFNVLALPPGEPSPALIFSTHMDVVPPHIASSEDAENIYGRGACDAKGIIAAQIEAALQLRAEGIPAGLLFLVGEERDSQGAEVANLQPCGSRFLINGEPTENCVAIASKGTLRVQVTSSGRMAHSAYPHLGESAIDKLIQALTRLRAMQLPLHPRFGATDFNIGAIEGGRAPNVIPDFARAQLLYRLVGDSQKLRADILSAVGGLAQVEFLMEIPFMELEKAEGLPSMMAAFTTDIPSLSRWGKPVLCGPGSIHVAHTDGEYVARRQLTGAVAVYLRIARSLIQAA